MTIGQFPGMGFQNPQKVVAEEVIIIGPDGSVLVYDPSQTLGDLVDSIVAVSGNDGVGNKTIAGFTSYAPNAGLAATLDAGLLGFFTGPDGGGGPWTLQSDISPLQGVPNPVILLSSPISGFTVGLALVFPSADVTGASDIFTILALIGQKFAVWLMPGQYYVNGTLDLKPYPGCSLIGVAGKVNIQMVVNNTPFLQTAGLGQDVENITFEYAAQQGVTDTLSNGWEVGDDTYGSCFDSTFRNLTFIKVYTGWVTNPAITTVSGIFDCDINTIRIFGWYNQAINLIGGNAVGAGNTTCEIHNLFVHNNEAGPRANTASWPVLFDEFSELIINSMSIQDAEVDASDCLALVNNGSVTINGLHFEALDLGGDDYGFVYVSHNQCVNINSMTIQFCSSNPTTYNSVFRMFGNTGENVSLICNGPNLLNNTIDKLLYWVDFSATGPGGTSTAETQTCIINGIANDTSTTGTFIGFIAGSTLTFTPAPWNYVGAAGQPAFAADWGNAGGGNANLAFRMINPDNVQIIGVITPDAGAAVTIFTLPSGFIPASDQPVLGANRTTAAMVDYLVRSSGAVEIIAAGGGVLTDDTYDINGNYSLSL